VSHPNRGLFVRILGSTKMLAPSPKVAEITGLTGKVTGAGENKCKRVGEKENRVSCSTEEKGNLSLEQGNEPTAPLKKGDT